MEVRRLAFDTARLNKLQTVLDKAVDNKKIFGSAFGVKKGDYIWVGSSGNLTIDRPYFIASSTKLFTSALIFNLRSRGLLSLDDSISRFIDKSVLHRLHVFKGKEYSETITVKHLLAHTSGTGRQKFRG
jgi:D-alanyl-D-alanine carboxypeptidase